MSERKIVKRGDKVKAFLINGLKFEGVVISIDDRFLKINDIKKGETILNLDNVLEIEIINENKSNSGEENDGSN